MNKKFNLEIVRKIFEVESYTLLSNKYINTHTKLDFICPNGHKHNISFAKWLLGRRCKYCAGQGQPTIEFIGSEFTKENYVLLTKQYVNSKQKLEYICPKGHKHSITWGHWQQGQRCPYCAGNKKLNIDFIRSEFEKEGYTFLTTEYTNSKQKLKYICPSGHKHSISWNEWGIGNRCPYCEGNAKLTIEFIRADFAKEDYKLLTKEYINCKQKLNYICPNGHRHSISWNKWKNGERCPVCYRISNVGSNHPMWKGGISAEPYCLVWLDKKFKESILERDNYQCQNPDCWGTSEKLCGHHIDYNKKNCDPFNIITVCDSCNGRANFDREYWQNFYTDIMIKRGLSNV